ncbi:MAG: hypothetical protein WC878_06035 [Candidatus Paceibacterota bacterium]
MDKTVTQIHLPRKTRECGEPEPKDERLAEDDEKHDTLSVTNPCDNDSTCKVHNKFMAHDCRKAPNFKHQSASWRTK